MENTDRYTVIIYSENQIGVLAWVSNTFTRRSLSIWSLTARPTDIPGIHSIIIETDGTRKKVEEAADQLAKRVEVVKVYWFRCGMDELPETAALVKEYLESRGTMASNN